MKIACQRCIVIGMKGVQDCCEWGNCKLHCRSNHFCFGNHYESSWSEEKSSDYSYSYSYKSEPSPGHIEEEAETMFIVKDWPSGGSLDLEGELW